MQFVPFSGPLNSRKSGGARTRKISNDITYSAQTDRFTVSDQTFEELELSEKGFILGEGAMLLLVPDTHESVNLFKPARSRKKDDGTEGPPQKSSSFKASALTEMLQAKGLLPQDFTFSEDASRSEKLFRFDFEEGESYEDPQTGLKGMIYTLVPEEKNEAEKEQNSDSSEETEAAASEAQDGTEAEIIW